MKMDYLKEATRTEVEYTDEVVNRMIVCGRLLHGAMGLCTEAGEFQDQLKRHIYYGAELDLVNLNEEIGDMLYYVAILCDTLGLTIEQVMEANSAKLRERYPEKFTEHNALNRDAKKELDALALQPDCEFCDE